MANELRQPTDEKARDDAARVALIERSILVLLARDQPNRGPASRAKLFAQDQQIWGIFMIVWGLFVGMVDNFIKPWLIGFGIEMPMLLTILGSLAALLLRLPGSVHWTDPDRQCSSSCRPAA